MPPAHAPSATSPVVGLINDPLYLAGLQHFDAGEFFEAHEILEERWKAAPAGSADRLFLQGLIQLAVAILKWQRQNRRGALFLHHRSLLKWSALPDTYAGMNLATLRAQTRVLFAPLENAPATCSPADLPPLASSSVPRLRVEGAKP
ncbi:MAG TPA: DUF309 domain-containing protein [Planctomycetota bacterium]|nr:DUF309 domain-containing protein [Planctomycetota bacterium]